MIKFIHKLRRRKNYDKRRKNKVFKRKNGFTQKDIATKLGVESAAISKYELDMRVPNIETIKNQLQFLMFRWIIYLEEHQMYLQMKQIEIHLIYMLLKINTTLQNCKIIDAIYKKINILIIFNYICLKQF